ncbi:hypothetical protein AVEN_143785-1 [Araneus ventricosus]|uniref:Uncharacterized protein n=1 Tax=Araneus ventricosus TaxID=182803 RepID=A0A4Y2AQR7_ARAVE|nr:hypothetical protein AVEN_143785-1 [Araneus ventricosus]
MHGKGYQENPHFCRRVLSNVTLRSLKQYPVDPIVNDIVSLAKIRGLEVVSHDINCRRAQPRADLRRAFGVVHSKKLWKRVCQRRRSWPISAVIHEFAPGIVILSMRHQGMAYIDMLSNIKMKTKRSNCSKKCRIHEYVLYRTWTGKKAVSLKTCESVALTAEESQKIAKYPIKWN